MQDDEAHAVQNALVHAVHDFIRNLVVRHMAPPDQHVRAVQHLLRQPMLRLPQRGGSDVHTGVLQKVRNTPVDALRVHLRDLRKLHLMQIFIPYRYTNCHNVLLPFLIK